MSDMSEEEAMALAMFAFKVQWDLLGFARRISSAAPVPGHEPLLLEVGHDPLQARFMAYTIQRLGKEWADERNLIARPLVIAMRRVAKAAARTALVMSRRAKDLRALLDRGEADGLIKDGIDRSGLALTVEELRRIVDLAAIRDESACRRLGQAAQALLRYMPEPRGRPVSAKTGIHFFLLLELKLSGHRRAYTWCPAREDYVDASTWATRVALNDPDFDPRHACRLLKTGRLGC